MIRLKALLILLCALAAACGKAPQQEGAATANNNGAMTRQLPSADFRDQDGRTELMRTIETGGLDDVKKLIDAGADVNAKSKTGITALHTAAGMGKADIVRELIARKADVNAEASGGYTPLMQAALVGRTEVVKILLDAGADPARKEQVTGKTAAQIAEQQGNKELAALLKRK